MKFHHFSYNMGLRDVLLWWSRSSVNQPVIADESSLIAGDDAEQLHEPFEHAQKSVSFDFHRASIRPNICRTHSSLLTKAIHSDNTFENSMELVTSVNISRSMRPRSIISTTSLELTSDTGTTSTSHSQVSSPSQDQKYHNLQNFGTDDQSLTKAYHSTNTQQQTQDIKLAEIHTQVYKKVSCPDSETLGSPGELLPSSQINPATSVRNACTTTGTRSRSRSEPESSLQPRCNLPLLETSMTPDDAAKLLPRKPTIKFACHGPPPSKVLAKPNLNGNSLSPNPRFPRDLQLLSSVPSTSSIKSIKIDAQAPSNITVHLLQVPYKSKETLEDSQSTGFHEFASGEIEIDDWVRHDLGDLKQKLTIKDTLKKENEIRRLASEAEEEELEEEEAVATSNDEGEKEEEDDEDGSDDNLEDSDDSDLSEYYWNHGDKTYDDDDDFADSDESDERHFATRVQADKITLAFSKPKSCALSNSSIDSLPHLHNALTYRRFSGKLKPTYSDLPDSTDFVCGTLDEDRPLEEAYLSCMEARKQARHKSTPQDIDPSFPASDSDAEKNENCAIKYTSDEHEYPYNDKSDEENGGRKCRTLSRNRSSIEHYSPKKLHSPPPPKQRLRPPPSRKLRINSPEHIQTSISNSKPSHEETLSVRRPITFSTLGNRPGPTYTKSLPRTSNHFYSKYHTECLGTCSDCDNEDGKSDNHVRGAIDIVKGLEHKRQRRKEKLYTKQTSRRVKGYNDRKNQPGEGAERMREVGLFIAGKSETQKPYIISA